MWRKVTLFLVEWELPTKKPWTTNFTNGCTKMMMSVSSSSRSLSDLKFLTPFQRKRKKKECYFSTFSFFSSSFCVFSRLSGEEEEEGVKKRKNEVAKTALQICFAAFLFLFFFLLLFVVVVVYIKGTFNLCNLKLFCAFLPSRLVCIISEWIRPFSFFFCVLAPHSHNKKFEVTSFFC